MKNLYTGLSLKTLMSCSCLLVALLFATGIHAQTQISVVNYVVSNNYNCAPYYNGAVEGYALGGNGYYDYSCSCGQPDQYGTYYYFFGLAPGTYTITATDGVDSAGTTSDTIIDYSSGCGPGQISVGLYSESDNYTCAPNYDGYVYGYATGGNGNYDFSCGCGQPDQYGSYFYFYGLAPGTYTITATDGTDSAGTATSTINDYSSGCGPGQISVGLYSESDNYACAPNYDGWLYGYATGGNGYYDFSCGCGQPDQYGSYFYFTGLAPGIYAITATDGSDSTGTDSVTINDYSSDCGPDQISVGIYEGDNYSCAPNYDGWLYGYATGGTGNYDFSCGCGQPDQYGSYFYFYGLAPGTYTITATDGTDSAGTATATINDYSSGCSPGQISVGLYSESDNYACAPNYDGWLYGYATGGNGYYDFSCGCGQPDQYGSYFYFTGLAPGIYAITATDGSDSTGTDSVTINDYSSDCGPDQISMGIYEGDNYSCAPNYDGWLYGYATGGTGNYDFSCGCGQPDQYGSYFYFYGLAPGTYTITATDGTDSSGTATATINDYSSGCSPGQISVGLYSESDNYACAPNYDGWVYGYATGGTGNYDFSCGCGQPDQYGSYFYFTGLAPGTYAITATDGSDTTGTDSVTINDYSSGCGPGQISVGIYEGDNYSCAPNYDGWLYGYATGGNGYYDFSCGCGQPDQYGSYFYFYGLAPGTYTITATDGTDSSGTATATINDYSSGCSPGQISVGLYSESDNYACAPNYDGWVYGYATGGTGNYDFSCGCGQPDQYGSYFYFTGLAPGIYAITATDGSDTTGTDSVTINDYSSGCGPGQISVGIYEGDNYSCAPNYDGWLYGYATGGNGYYDFSCGCGQPDQYGSYFYFYGLAPGTYTITATDGTDSAGTATSTINDYSSGCSPGQISVGLYSESDNYACAPNYDGWVYGYATGGTGNYDFSCGCGQPDQYGSYFYFTGLAPGTYAITATDGSDTTGTDSVTINDYSSGCGPGQISVGIYEGDNYSCAPNYDGWLYGYAIGGTGNYDFSCGCGQPDQYGSYFYFTGLAPGTYAITSSDGVDTVGTDSVTINDYSSGCGPFQIYVGIDGGGNYGCAPDYDGSVSGYVWGGNGNYDISCSCGEPDQYGVYFDFAGLASGTYIVSATDGSDYAGADSAIVNNYSFDCSRPSAQVTGIVTVSDNQQISIWSNTNLLYVDFTRMSKVQATIRVYNILGQELYSDKYASNTVYKKEIDNIEVGYIIVTVKNNDDIITKKLFISSDK